MALESAAERRARIAASLAQASGATPIGVPPANAPPADAPPETGSAPPGVSIATAFPISAAETRNTPPASVGDVSHKAQPKPTAQQQTHFLMVSDLETIDEQTRLARASGVKLRKNGNPSLFVRAGIRLLEDLRRSNPDEWLRRVRHVAEGDK